MHYQLIRWLAPLAGVAALLAFVMLSSPALAQVEPDDVPAALEDAIKAKVELEGHQYAGLCEEIAQDGSTIGQYCAAVLALSETEAEVTYGPVASEPTAHITFVFADGEWSHPGGGPGEGEADEIPDDLREAIRDFVEDLGVEYAGLCTEIPQDGTTIGQFCAGVEMVSDTSARVSYGQVASDALKTVEFEKRDGAWVPKTVDSPATPRPPDTGNGSVGQDGDASLAVVGILAGILLVSGAGLVAVRQR